MRRIDTSTKAVDLFGAGKHGFKNGDPSLAILATKLNAEFFNATQEELASLIEYAGLTLDDADNTQLRQAISALITASIPAASTDGIAGSFANLKASATGTSAAITVTADSVCVKSASNQQKVLNAVSLSVSGAANGANGLDTGALAVSTWYYLWVIWNGTTTAGLLSLSSTAPTMPSGYTHKARVGAIRTDASGNKYPLSFVQAGRKAQYKVLAGSNVAALPMMVSGTSGSLSTPTWTAVAVGVFVPPTATEIDVVVGGNFGTSGGAMVAPNASYGAQGSLTNSPPWSRSASAAEFDVQAVRMTLESANIYYASNTQTFVQCFGWEDNL